MPPKASKFRRLKNADLLCTDDFVDAECQTDLYDEEFARSVQEIKALKSDAKNESGDSIFASKNVNVLYFQLKACKRIILNFSNDAQKSHKENERIISFLGEIFRLVRVMRSEYDSTFVNVQDNIKAMSCDMSRYVNEVLEFLAKQKSILEDERKRFKNCLKGKDVQIEHLQEKLAGSGENLKIIMQALEAQQRRITISERDAHVAREEVKDVNRKLNDQLFIAENQKCMSCQANEKVREMLSNEVAEKTNAVQNLNHKCYNMEIQLMQQKRVNEILSKAVDKHSFSEKAYRGEFERIKSEYDALLAENRHFKEMAKLGNENIASNSSLITPPDSSSDKSLKDESRGNDSAHKDPAIFSVSQKSSTAFKNGASNSNSETNVVNDCEGKNSLAKKEKLSNEKNRYSSSVSKSNIVPTVALQTCDLKNLNEQEHVECSASKKNDAKNNQSFQCNQQHFELSGRETLKLPCSMPNPHSVEAGINSSSPKNLLEDVDLELTDNIMDEDEETADPKTLLFNTLMPKNEKSNLLHISKPHGNGNKPVAVCGENDKFDSDVNVNSFTDMKNETQSVSDKHNLNASAPNSKQIRLERVKSETFNDSPTTSKCDFLATCSKPCTSDAAAATEVNNKKTFIKLPHNVNEKKSLNQVPINKKSKKRARGRSSSVKETFVKIPSRCRNITELRSVVHKTQRLGPFFDNTLRVPSSSNDVLAGPSALFRQRRVLSENFNSCRGLSVRQLEQQILHEQQIMREQQMRREHQIQQIQQMRERQMTPQPLNTLRRCNGSIVDNVAKIEHLSNEGPTFTSQIQRLQNANNTNILRSMEFSRIIDTNPAGRGDVFNSSQRPGMLDMHYSNTNRQSFPLRPPAGMPHPLDSPAVNRMNGGGLPWHNSGASGPQYSGQPSSSSWVRYPFGRG